MSTPLFTQNQNLFGQNVTLTSNNAFSSNANLTTMTNKINLYGVANSNTANLTNISVFSGGKHINLGLGSNMNVFSQLAMRDGLMPGGRSIMTTGLYGSNVPLDALVGQLAGMMPGTSIQINSTCCGNNKMSGWEKFALVSNAFGGAQNLLGVGASLLGGILNCVGGLFGGGESTETNGGWGDQLLSWLGLGDNQKAANKTGTAGVSTGGAAPLVGGQSGGNSSESAAPASTSQPAPASAPAAAPAAAPASAPAAAPASSPSPAPSGEPTSSSGTGTTEQPTAQILNTNALNAAIKEYEATQEQFRGRESTARNILANKHRAITTAFNTLKETRNQANQRKEELRTAAETAKTRYQEADAEGAARIEDAMNRRAEQEEVLAENTKQTAAAKTRQRENKTQLTSAKNAAKAAERAFEQADPQAENYSQLQEAWEQAERKVRELEARQEELDNAVTALETTRRDTIEPALQAAKDEVEAAKGEQNATVKAAYDAMIEAEQKYREQCNVVADYDGQIQAIQERIPAAPQIDESQPAPAVTP